MPDRRVRRCENAIFIACRRDSNWKVRLFSTSKQFICLDITVVLLLSLENVQKEKTVLVDFTSTV